MKVHRWPPGRGEPTESGLRRTLEEGGFTVTRYVYPPGSYFPDHRHPVDKRDGVLSGRFRLRSGDQEVVLGPGDFAEVPAGCTHSAEVLGDEPVVSLDATRRA